MVEEYGGKVETQIQRSRFKEVLVVGGDHNAHIGGGKQRGGARGGHGMRDSNGAGEELIIWCEEKTCVL